MIPGESIALLMEIDIQMPRKTMLKHKEKNIKWCNLKKDEYKLLLASVYDIAENYAGQYQDEVKSTHWHHNQEKIHPGPDQFPETTNVGMS